MQACVSYINKINIENDPETKQNNTHTGIYLRIKNNLMKMHIRVGQIFLANEYVTFEFQGLFEDFFALEPS